MVRRGAVILKIVHFFNLANDAYMIVKGLRKIGVEADLVVMKYGSFFQHPHWEEIDSEIPFMPYVTDEVFQYFMNKWKPPFWIRFLDIGNKKGLIKRISVRFRMIRMMREYDLVIAHTPSSIYAMFAGVPYIPFDAGYIRYILGPNLRQRLALKSYKAAPFIIYTNPDTKRIFESASLENKLVFIPFAIDTEKYSPSNEIPNEVPTVILFPTRHIWQEKGNDIAIMAFDRYQKKFNPNAELHLCKWGKDLELSISLIKKLGTRNIIWHETLSKLKLITLYRKADVVLDQFVLGSYGTLTPEAMSCSKPVLTYLDKDTNLEAFGEMPPVVNVKTPEEIFDALTSLDRTKLLELGRKGRNWVLMRHSLEAVAKLHMNLYKKVIDF